jgi:hypothetical protein
MLSHETGLLLKLTPETISSKKKVGLVLPPPFTKDVGSGFRDPRSGSRISDPKSGIKHPGSVTLVGTKGYFYKIITQKFLSQEYHFASSHENNYQLKLFLLY